MSNFGDRRAKYEQNVRFRAPNADPKIHLPPRVHKKLVPPHYPFNLGTDISSVRNRIGAERSKAPTAPLKQEKAPEELPIYKKKDEIIRCARSAKKVLLEAETGSGKTSTVPVLINGEGYPVTVLGPRRLPASELAAFGARARNEEVGESIGFAHAMDRKISDKSEIIYATEGYELARQLHNPLSDDHVLIFDEFHERTANAVALLGFYKMREAQGLPVPKIWVMTATPNKEQIVAYLGEPSVISVEGRKYSITQLEKGASPSADAVRFLKEGLNPLSFHYGVRDIDDHVMRVRRDAPEGSEIYPLHSKLGRDEQKAALEPKPNKAIAATNTAQTSLTPVGMRAVIITGLIRRLVLDNQGVRTLIIDDITQAEYLQQMGRVGRTEDGFVVSHSKPYNELRPHAPSEIQNSPLESLILRFAAANISFRRLNRYLIDQAPEKHIQLAEQVLFGLGLLGPQGHITDLGHRVAQMPCDPRMGKLLIKAADYQREYKVEILDEAVRIAAVIEAEGILSGDGSKWQRLGSSEKMSDLIKQALVFQRAHNMTPEQRDVIGIDEINYQRACDIERMLRRRMNLSEEASPRSAEKANETFLERQRRQEAQQLQRKWLSRAIVEAHVDCVFRFVRRNDAGDYLYKPISGDRLAVLQKQSVVGGARLIVGSRFNIEFLDDSGNKKIQPLLLNAHGIDDELDWLETHTPRHLQPQLKEGITQAFPPSRRKEKGMKSRDFRKGKSPRNGWHGYGKGNG